MRNIAIGDPQGPNDWTWVYNALKEIERASYRADEDNSFADIATSGSASDLVAGTVPAARMPALTGDVTTAAGSVATTIANDAVTNAKAANMVQATIKGRASGAGTGDPTDLTASQVMTILGLTGLTNESGTFAPSDGSGASLTFSAALGTYVKVGVFVLVVVAVTYPTTADTNTAVIAGLPFVFAGSGGDGTQSFPMGYSDLNSTGVWSYNTDGGTSIRISTTQNLTLQSNAQCSGKTFRFVHAYRTT